MSAARNVAGDLARALETALASPRQDPVLAYCLLAAGLLAVVAVATGLLRRDAAVLLRPRLLLRVMGAIVVAFGLWMLGALLQRSLGAGPASDTVSGLARFPLYLVTLAYGPLVGLVTGGLFAGLQAGGWLPGWNAAMLALELAVLGWLAIYPSPRRDRWAGPFDAVLAYGLAWGTGGLALLEARHGTVTAAGLWSQHQHALLGVAASVALLALVPPAAYRTAFPGSRIAPPDTGDASDGGRTEARGGPGRDPLTLTQPELPRTLKRGRKRRELEPFPHLGDQDGD